jgi:hypothetical protein
MTLLPSQKNDVITAVRSAGFSPSDFTWSPVMIASNLFGVRLGFRDTAYHFDFADDGKHGHSYSPGKEHLYQRGAAGAWVHQVGHVGAWLENLRREVEAPDLWSELSEQTTIEVVDTTDVITAADRVAIGRVLRELREYIVSTTTMTHEKLDAVDARLAYLEGAADRLGKKDWINAAIGVALNIVTAAALPPDVASEAMRMFWRGLRMIATGSPLLPGILQ